MKVMEVISDTNIGGAGILLLNRLECTDMNRYGTTVCLPEKSRLIPRLDKIGVRYIALDIAPDRSWHMSDVIKFKRIFDRELPTVVNCHGALSARVAAKLSGVPIKICTRHCVYDVSLIEKLTGRINSFLSDAFIAVAHSARENLLGMGVSEGKIHVIINGAKRLNVTTESERQALRLTLGINANDFVLTICARLEICKGHTVLFDALSRLKKRVEKYKVIVIGDGTQRERLENYCADKGLTKNVIFIGFTEDVSPYMNISDLNINCSVGTETSSLALSEGMSIGLPAVVSDYGGNSYMIKDGVNGFVYKCGDSKRLSELILRLANNREELKSLSVGAYARYENELNVESMTKKTNRLYDELVMHHKVGGS